MKDREIYDSFSYMHIKSNSLVQMTKTLYIYAKSDIKMVLFVGLHVSRASSLTLSFKFIINISKLVF